MGNTDKFSASTREAAEALGMTYVCLAARTELREKYARNVGTGKKGRFAWDVNAMKKDGIKSTGRGRPSAPTSIGEGGLPGSILKAIRKLSEPTRKQLEEVMQARQGIAKLQAHWPKDKDVVALANKNQKRFAMILAKEMEASEVVQDMLALAF